MADRVGSDHPSVRTIRGRLVRRGGTVRLIVGGRERHAPVGARGETRAAFGAYDNARRAREREGADRLAEWVEARGLEFGRAVLVDVVEPGEVYGLRAPGEDAVYEVRRGPADSLRRIAEDLEP